MAQKPMKIRAWMDGDKTSVKAIMFHQSLPTLEDWPNPVVLSQKQMRAYLTLSDMDVLGPLMLGDSDAWNVCETMTFTVWARSRLIGPKSPWARFVR